MHDKGRANTVIHSKPLQGPAPLQKARRQEGCRFDWKAETFSPASASPATGRPESPHISLFALIPHGRGGDGDVGVRGGGGGVKVSQAHIHTFAPNTFVPEQSARILKAA